MLIYSDIFIKTFKMVQNKGSITNKKYSISLIQ